MQDRESGVRPTLAPTPRLIDPALELDQASEAAADALGIREIPIEWKRFVDKSIAKGEISVDFHALFRSRLSFVRNDQRRARDQDARAAQRPGVSGRSEVDDDEAKRRRQEKHKALLRELDAKHLEMLKAKALKDAEGLHAAAAAK